MSEDFDAILAEASEQVRKETAVGDNGNNAVSADVVVAHEDDDGSSALQQQQQEQQPAGATAAAGGVMHDPAGLIPMMVQNAADPASFRPDIFGYDIKQLAERPWAKPGANLSDYFNYGFDEQSWRVYCALQMRGLLSHKHKADAFLASILHDVVSKPAQSQPGGGSGAGGGMFYGGGGGGGGMSAPAPVSGGKDDGADDGSGMMHMHHHHHSMSHHHHGMHMQQSRFQQHHHHHQHHHHGGGHQPGVSYFKTRLCNAFMQTGSCMNGASCRYAHGEADRMPMNLPRMPRSGGGIVPVGMAPVPSPGAAGVGPMAAHLNYFDQGAPVESGERPQKMHRAEDG